MGCNITVVVLTDALEQIKNDKEFGKKLVEAVHNLNAPADQRVMHPLYISAGNHCNAATVIEDHHADQVKVIAVGGNMGSVIGYGGNWKNMREGDENKENILRSLAAELGFQLHKRPKAKA